MSKRFIVSLMVIIMVAACLGGSAVAAFLDVESSPDNSFSAGTLDLKVEDQDDPNVTPTLIGLDLINMKATVDKVITIHLKNIGSIDGVATIKFTDVVGSNVGTKTDLEVEDENVSGPYVTEVVGSSDIDAPHKWTGVTITFGGTGVNLSGYDDDPADGKVTIYELENDTITLGDLPSGGQVKDLVFTFNLDPDGLTGNVFQGDNNTFDLEFGLNQA